MVKMVATYSGGLHCEVEHKPSSSLIETDAPKDNMGKGEKFSPTDLLGASLTSCILTTMAIVAEREGISLLNGKAEVEKEMVSSPYRRVGSLHVKVYLPRSVPEASREKLERAAWSCPVKKSLNPEIQAEISFQYT